MDSEASKNPVESIKRMREALNFLSEYVLDNGYNLRFALEPKPNEPRPDTYLPTIGHMMAFIGTLDHPEMIGVNPEVAHEYMVHCKAHHSVIKGFSRQSYLLCEDKGVRCS